jgi:hypothetical protein
MATLILEVGIGLEFYVSGAKIVIRCQRPKPTERPPMPLETQEEDKENNKHKTEN